MNNAQKHGKSLCKFNFGVSKFGMKINHRTRFCTGTKRIVSKGKYAEVQARRFWGWLHVACAFVVALYFIVSALWRSGTRLSLHTFSCIDGFYMLLASAIAAASYCAGRSHLKQTRAIEPVLPFTRANTADLPAPDSLVRASQEPVQAQEGILLRAAMEGQEKREEQLLRASASEYE